MTIKTTPHPNPNRREGHGVDSVEAGLGVQDTLKDARSLFHCRDWAPKEAVLLGVRPARLTFTCWV